MRQEIASWTWTKRPQDEQVFEEMMADLDAQFSKYSVAIPARQLTGIHAVSHHLGFNGTSFFPDRQRVHPPWSASDLFIRVGDWFEERYGAMLEIDPSPGSTVVELRGVLWRLRLPRLFGGGTIFASRNQADEGITLDRHRPASMNVVRAVQGLTQELSNSLTDSELASITDAWLQGFKATRALDRMPDDLLFKQAAAHYRGSVDELLRRDGVFGYARRETALCCEKVLKGALTRLKIDFKKNHDLLALADLFYKGTVHQSPIEDLSAIQCSADVSYQRAVNLSEALGAHKALRRVLHRLDPGGMPCEIRIGGVVTTEAWQTWIVG